MPFVDDYTKTTYIDEDVQPTGTPDINAANLNNNEDGTKELYTALSTLYTSHESLEAAVAALSGVYQDTTLITGLILEYVNTTQIKINSGACYVPAAGLVSENTSAQTITPAGLSASTMYYVYGLNVGGNLTFVHSTTAPVAYRGSAKHKSGDSSQRYIGAFKTNSSNQIVRFQDDAHDQRIWVVDTGVTTVWNSTSTPTSVQTISCAAWVPASTQRGLLLISAYNNQSGGGTGKSLYVGTPDMGTVSSSNNLASLGTYDFSEADIEMDFPLNASRQMTLVANGSSQHHSSVVVRGYYEER